MRQPVRTQDKRQVLHTCRPCVCALCVRARARGTAEWRPSKTESIAAMLAPEASLAQCATSTALVHLGSPNASASCGRSGASALPPDRMYSEITRPSCCCAAANPRRHRQSCICMRRAAPGAWRGSDTRRQRRQAGGRAAGRLWRDRPVGHGPVGWEAAATERGGRREPSGALEPPQQGRAPERVRGPRPSSCGRERRHAAAQDHMQ